MRSWSKLFLVAIFVVALRAPAGAVTFTATISAVPTTYNGSCPGAIKFTGGVSAFNWAPGEKKEIQYQWIRSDSSRTNIRTLDFSDGSKSKSVSSTWTLGGPGTQYKGYETLAVVYPHSGISNQAQFTLNCTGTAVTVVVIQMATPPPVQISATLQAHPVAAPGPCPFPFAFFGSITTGAWPAGVTPEVDYQFVRSNGDKSDVHTLMFDAAGGTKKVNEVWNKETGGNGWEEIKILQPHDATSNQATVQLRCNH